MKAMLLVKFHLKTYRVIRRVSRLTPCDSKVIHFLATAVGLGT
jgi:hypothetical protein